jgi:hypothetical protein
MDELGAAMRGSDVMGCDTKTKAADHAALQIDAARAEGSAEGRIVLGIKAMTRCD